MQYLLGKSDCRVQRYLQHDPKATVQLSDGATSPEHSHGGKPESHTELKTDRQVRIKLLTNTRRTPEGVPVETRPMMRKRRIKIIRSR
jgi:hypothetical protein